MDLAATERVFVAVARTATLATIAPDGRPRLIPICFVLERAAPVVWTPLDDKPKRSDDPRDLARVRDIVARPAVSIIVDRWDEDWDRLAWVRIHGQATLAEPGTADHEVAVSALRAKYPRYADHRLESRPMIRIVIESATSWGAINPADPSRTAYIQGGIHLPKSRFRGV